MRKLIVPMLCVLPMFLFACGGGGGGGGAGDTGGSPIPSIAAGERHSLVTMTDGTLWAWGRNDLSQCGTDSGGADITSPTRIGSDTDWESVEAGQAYSLALKNDGTLWAWGNNTYSQCGTATGVTNITAPTQVSSDTDWESVSSFGNHTLAIKNDGTLWGWGNNLNNQSAEATANTITSPTQSGADLDWAAVSAGFYHSLALKDDGTLWAWGANVSSECGFATGGSDVTAPTRVGGDSDWASVAAGFGFSLALKENGTLWAWGGNSYSQCGTDTGGFGTNISTPTQVDSDSDWVSVTAGHYHSLGMKNNGTIWAWGSNFLYECGFESSGANINSPTQIEFETDWVSFTAGHSFNLAVRGNDILWAWGDNSDRKCGLDTGVAPIERPIGILLLY